VDQAQQAALVLAGSDHEEAARTLRALGPFGADALRAVMNLHKDDARRKAEQVLQEIEKEWPSRDNAIRTLGINPALWRRWWAEARAVL